MSIHDKLAAIADELHLTGFGHELSEALKRTTGALADHVHELEQKVGVAGAVDPRAIDAKLTEIVEATVRPFLDELKQLVDGRLHALEDAIAALQHPQPQAAEAAAEPAAELQAPAAGTEAAAKA